MKKLFILFLAGCLCCLCVGCAEANNDSKDRVVYVVTQKDGDRIVKRIFDSKPKGDVEYVTSIIRAPKKADYSFITGGTDYEITLKVGQTVTVEFVPADWDIARKMGQEGDTGSIYTGNEKIAVFSPGSDDEFATLTGIAKGKTHLIYDSTVKGGSTIVNVIVTE